MFIQFFILLCVFHRTCNIVKPIVIIAYLDQCIMRPKSHLYYLVWLSAFVSVHWAIRIGKELIEVCECIFKSGSNAGLNLLQHFAPFASRPHSKYIMKATFGYRANFSRVKIVEAKTFCINNFEVIRSTKKVQIFLSPQLIQAEMSASRIICEGSSYAPIQKLHLFVNL